MTSNYVRLLTLFSLAITSQVMPMTKSAVVTIHKAAQQNNVQELSKLLSSGADGNACNERGLTPLHLAASAGHEKVVALLVAFNVKTDLKTKQGETALELAMENGHTKIVALLQSFEDKLSHDEYDESVNAQTMHEASLKSPEISIGDLEKTDSEGKTALHKACEQGKVKVVENLLKQDANVNACNRNGGTPLHAASIQGYYDICNLLIDAGASCDAVNNFGNTPLHVAAMKGHTEIVCKLLAHAKSITLKNNDGRTVYDLAELNNHTALAEFLRDEYFPQEADNVVVKHAPIIKTADGLAEGADTSHHSQNPQVQTNVPYKDLHSAVRKGDAGAVKSLLKLGADVNALDQDKNSPLDLAIQLNHLEVCKRLVDYAPELVVMANKYSPKPLNKKTMEALEKNSTMRKFASQIKDKSGQTYLHKLLREAAFSYDKLCKKLVKYVDDVKALDSDGNTLLHHMARYADSKKLIVQLVAKGAQVNVKDKFGQTPLHLAHRSYLFDYGIDIMKALIGLGADVNAKSHLDETPLFSILKNVDKDEAPEEQQARLKAIQYLISQKADIACSNVEGHTLLHIASENGQSEVVELLLPLQGGLLNLHTIGGDTALDIATRQGDSEVISVLTRELQRRVKQRIAEPSTDLHGWTPLHRAAHSGDLATCKKLLKNRAEIEAKDIWGWTPLHRAAYARHGAICKLLLEKKANVNAQDRDNETPLIKAVVSNFGDIIPLLIAQGAQVNDAIKNTRTPIRNGYTALHFAAFYNSAEACIALLKKGAQKQARDQHGLTAFDVAKKHERAEMCQLLQ